MTTPVWAVVLAPLFSFVALLTLASGANAAESRIEKTLTLPPGGRFDAPRL